MLMITGLTYRKLDHWTNTGRLNGHRHQTEKRGSGVPTFWSAEEADVAERMVRLMGMGFALDTAAVLARYPERISDTIRALADLAHLPVP
jgi:hypothetical protein